MTPQELKNKFPIGKFSTHISVRPHDLVDILHLESIEWRHPWKKDFKSGVLVGKHFRMGRSLGRAKTYLHTCHKADWVSNKKQAVIHYKFGIIDSCATYFQLPMRKQKTQDEIKKDIMDMFPGCKLHVPSVGCSLHGDIDATLTLSDGAEVNIAWNY